MTTCTCCERVDRGCEFVKVVWSTKKVGDVHGPSSQRNGGIEHVVCIVPEEHAKLFGYFICVTQARKWRDDRLDAFHPYASQVTQVDQLRTVLMNLDSVLHHRRCDGRKASAVSNRDQFCKG